eukprot:TRINITY_DN32165_c0_g1_i1.p1 TRINITY_DN32165_c0_g1~~TRINITY_DN32165_c0_g1_i1.p1  ORF type:complete len:582 (+),score=68.17 TRINITY_DN32165_c0_g1_i1:88-1833(+)
MRSAAALALMCVCASATVMSVDLRKKPVTGVVVYGDRAHVSRDVPLKLPVGTHEVTLIVTKPHTIPIDTIRVQGTGPLSVVGMTSEARSPSVDVNATEVKAAEERLTEAAEELDAESRALEMKRRGRDTVRSVLEKGMEWNKMRDIDSYLSVVDPAWRRWVSSAESNVERLESIVAARRQELNDSLSLDEQEPQMSVTVFVVVTEAKEPTTLHFSYFRERRCSWSPGYDLHFSSSGAAAELVFRATVTQTTAENWEGARVVLSTASAFRQGKPPVLPAVTVGMKERDSWSKQQTDSAMRQAYAALYTMTSTGYGDSAPSTAQSARPSPAPGANTPLPGAGSRSQSGDGGRSAPQRTRGSGGSVSYPVTGGARVRSNGLPYKVTIAELSLPSNITYHLIPAQSLDAYVQVRVNNTSEMPLLASSDVKIFVDGMFVMNSDMHYVSPGGEFTVFAGSDPDVEVSTLPPEEEHQTTGLLASGQQVVVKSTVEVWNGKGHPIRVNIVQRLPKPAHKDVKVELLEPKHVRTVNGSFADRSATAADKVLLDSKNGHVMWRDLVVNSRARRVGFKYAIQWPANAELVLS